MDAEAEIKRFDKESVKEYATKTLGSIEKQRELMEIAAKSGIITWGNKIIEGDWEAMQDVEDLNYGMLCIPFLLNMICCFFQSEDVSLPKTKTGIISAVVKRCPDWE